jgi:hypothetical protein
MATRPIICPPTPPNGWVFFKNEFVLEEDFNYTTFFNFKDLVFGVETYSRLQITLKRNKSILLSQTDIATEGFVRWIAVKVQYPAPKNPILFSAQTPIIPGLPRPTNGTPQIQKYINWTYQGKTYNLGELMVLSGNPLGSTDADVTGWNLSEYDLVYPGGGITFTNPHSDFDVKLQVLIAK